MHTENFENSVLLYLWNSPHSISQMASILTRNSKAGLHSLWVISESLILSAAHDPFLSFLYAVTGNKIYAYKVVEDKIYILPTYFYWHKHTCHHQFGLPVEISKLKFRNIERIFRGEPLLWKVASFEAHQTPQREHERFSFHRNYRYQHRSSTKAPRALEAYYRILGVDIYADEEQIRQAYRRLARLYHPDLNASSNAKTRMQLLNEAYKHLMKRYK